MEDVLGGRTDPERFATFLADWEPILGRRVNEAVAAIATVDGVAGLLLAGSVGRGEPWPLSDIDLLPVWDGDRTETARAEVERRRRALLGRWIDEGWWTGLDIGRLAFSRDEVSRILATSGPTVIDLLADDRWYHALDKGYQGRAVFDPHGLVAPLAQWLTRHRFDRTVVQFRLRRTRREIVDSERHVRACTAANDPLGAITGLRTAVKWLRTWMLEGWGERDASLGRIGTRFARLAVRNGRPERPDILNALSDLDETSVEWRMAAAPDWVAERHDRSWRARQHVGEDVTRLEDARDTLRVCSLYAARRISAPPYPTWLAIPSEAHLVMEKSACLAAIVERWLGDTP